LFDEYRLNVRRGYASATALIALFGEAMQKYPYIASFSLFLAVCAPNGKPC
jgi:hypothetical protein